MEKIEFFMNFSDKSRSRWARAHVHSEWRPQVAARGRHFDIPARNRRNHVSARPTSWEPHFQPQVSFKELVGFWIFSLYMCYTWSGDLTWLGGIRSTGNPCSYWFYWRSWITNNKAILWHFPFIFVRHGTPEILTTNPLLDTTNTSHSS